MRIRYDHAAHRCIHASTQIQKTRSVHLLVAIFAVAITVLILDFDEGNTFEQPAKMKHVQVPDESSKLYNLPPRSQITSVEAELYNVKGLFRTYPNVARFKVSPEHYDSVLAFFTHPRVDPLPIVEASSIGSLKITDKHGGVTQIVFFDRMGKGPLEYSIRGVRCYDGRQRHDFNDALTLDARLRYAHEQADLRH